MKKIFLTMIAAVLFVLTSAAQEKNQSDQYKTDKKSTEELSKQRRDSTMMNADTTSRDMQDVDADPTGREIEQSGEKAIQEADSAAQQNSDNLRDDVQQTEQEVEDKTEQVSEDIQRTGGEVERRADELGREGQQGVPTDSVDHDNMNKKAESGQTSQQQNQSTSASAAAAVGSGEGETTTPSNTMPAATVEVHESKEGPNGEVVYRINDELYYVDQTKERKLVKANESDLKDTSHKVTVKEGPELSKKSGKKTKKSKS